MDNIMKKEYKKLFKEKDFQSKILTPWLKKNGWTMAYEAKVSAGNTVNFKAFEAQQLPSLYKAKHTIIHHKISDMSINMKPFDGFCLHNELSYIIVMFNKDTKGGRDHFYMLEIDEVMKIKESGAKSINKQNCIDKGKVIGLGKKYLEKRWEES